MSSNDAPDHVKPIGVVALMPAEQSNRTAARRLTSSELREGYTVCACEKYAHIFRAEVLRRLPAGYDGELCKDCRLWMCALDKLKVLS
jgi:hypothetical protein